MKSGLGSDISESAGIVVEEEGMLSGDGHDKLTASDKIRLLLTRTQIDLAVPSTFLPTGAYAPIIPARQFGAPHTTVFRP